MNISKIQQNYTCYQTQSTSSTSKTESTKNDFASAMREVDKNKENKNKKIDLLDIQAFKNMPKEEKLNYHDELINKYGKDEGQILFISMGMASYSDDKNMQNAMFDTFSNMSKDDLLIFSLDLSKSVSRFKSGEKLEAGYSLQLDVNGNPFYGDMEKFNISDYFNDMSDNEFTDILSALFESHKKAEKVVGEQAKYFANIYDGILNSYKSYKDNEQNAYHPYV